MLILQNKNKIKNNNNNNYNGRSVRDSSYRARTTMAEFDDEFEIETPADFDMNNFLIEIGAKSQDIPEIIKEGFTEVEDLQSIDNEAVNSLNITSSSKTHLRMYILWRNKNITTDNDIMDLVNVNLTAIVKARDDNNKDLDQKEISNVTVRKSQSERDTDRELIRRQSILIIIMNSNYSLPRGMP
ncbi:MAG: hypothetical protein ACREBR_01210 [bacterium]